MLLQVYQLHHGVQQARLWRLPEWPQDLLGLSMTKNGLFLRVGFADWLLLSPEQTLPPAAGGLTG